MRTTLARNGTGYSTGTFKTYDVWGSVRSGGDSTDPKQKYVASLGHVSDDETGLIYMRARYYEPGSGRFVSEDPAMDGHNWYFYVKNSPQQRSDRDGTIDWSDESVWQQSIGWAFSLTGTGMLALSIASLPSAFTGGALIRCIQFAMAGVALAAMGPGLRGTFWQDLAAFGGGTLLESLGMWAQKAIGAKAASSIALEVSAAAIGSKSKAAIVVLACLAFSLACWVLLIQMDNNL